MKNESDWLLPAKNRYVYVIVQPDHYHYYGKM